MFQAIVGALFLYYCCVFGVKLQDFRNQLLQTTQVFHFSIDKSMFDASIGNYGTTVFRAALLGKPDLPKWMFLRQTSNSEKALLYGSYQDHGELNIEVFAINKYNYMTSLRVISLQVEKRQSEALYEVEMKFLNLNIEDLFEGDWLLDLEEIFRNHLWSNSPVIYITKVASVVDIGGRVPVNPKDKEGVVVRIGGTANFSEDLRTLELEANQLRNRVPCPRDYKRTSAEYRFRRKNFLSDWCGFRLITVSHKRKLTLCVHYQGCMDLWQVYKVPCIYLVQFFFCIANLLCIHISLLKKWGPAPCLCAPSQTSQNRESCQIIHKHFMGCFTKTAAIVASRAFR